MFDRIPPAIRALLVANVGVFVLQALFAQRLWQFTLWPLGVGAFQPWQLLTHGFMHGNLPHLVFNMLALVMFGGQLEYTWGARRFVTYYLACIVGAGVCQLAVVSMAVAQGSPPIETVGASGGVFGVLLAFGMLFPHQRVMLLFPPIPMKARTLVIVVGVIELVMGITGTRSGVAHFAHLGGLIVGWLLIRSWRRQPPFGGQRARRF